MRHVSKIPSEETSYLKEQAEKKRCSICLKWCRDTSCPRVVSISSRGGLRWPNQNSAACESFEGNAYWKAIDKELMFRRLGGKRRWNLG